MAGKVKINVEEHLGLVGSVLKTLYIPNYLYEDCVLQGNYGLVIAAEKFQLDRGNTFATYAWTSIKRNVISLLRQEKKIKESEQYINDYDPHYKKPKNVREYFPFNLSDQDLKLLNLHFFDRYTTSEIGNIYNTSGKYEMSKLKMIKERICRINQANQEF